MDKGYPLQRGLVPGIGRGVQAQGYGHQDCSLRHHKERPSDLHRQTGQLLENVMGFVPILRNLI